MKTLLTPSLLHFLIGQGYRYCLSKTSEINRHDAHVSITLSPVRDRPSLKLLPENFDTYFSIRRESARMARGIDDTLVFVKVPTIILLSYIDTLVSSFTLCKNTYV